MIGVIVRRITVGQLLRSSRTFFSGVGLDTEVVGVYFLLSDNTGSISAEQVKAKCL